MRKRLAVVLIALFYAVSASAASSITSPVGGSILTSGTVTFKWSATPGATGYSLWVGIFPGTANLANVSVFGTRATVKLPTTGATIYATLWTEFASGAPVPVIFTYLEFTAAAAALTSPTPDSVLASAETTFTWSPGVGGVNGYYLWVGTSSGIADLANLWVRGTSATVSLPANGDIVYVQLWTSFTGWVLLSNNYLYTEASTPYTVRLSWEPPMSSPDPVAGYNVYRAPDGSSNYTQLNTSAMTQTAYTDTTVTDGLTYDYIVESVDAEGITSVPSNTAVVPIP